MPVFPLAAGPRATRARILAGAREVFVARGVREATIDDLLLAGEVSRRTFYQYFKGRDDVIEALYDEVVGPIVARLAAAIGGVQDPLARIDAGLRAYMDHVQEGGAVLRVLQAEAARSDSVLAPRRFLALDAVVSVLSTSTAAVLGHALDPYVWRAMVLGIEGLVLHVQRAGEFRGETRTRVEASSLALLKNVLQGHEGLPKSPP